MSAEMRYGFRILGTTAGRRWLTDAAAALAAHAACDARAEPEREAYLSAFTFDAVFRTYLDERRSPRGFDGLCGADFIWWDIDHRGHLDRALAGARCLSAGLLERYRSLDDEDLLVFFSGEKGFHVGLPVGLWNPCPSPAFNRVARAFAQRIATDLGVGIDTSVYDKVRPFRAPNSKHPRTGLHKRRLSFDELLQLSPDGIRTLAERPAPFELPAPREACEPARADWRAAEQTVAATAKVRPERAGSAASTGHLQRETLEFIRAGTGEGERAIRLFRAAANLAEFGCPQNLAHALLTEPGLDSGMPPSEVRRQIECGLAHGAAPKGGVADG